MYQISYNCYKISNSHLHFSNRRPEKRCYNCIDAIIVGLEKYQLSLMAQMVYYDKL